MDRRWTADCDGRRDNNFTLLRILFAWMVIYSHAFALQPANGAHGCV